MNIKRGTSKIPSMTWYIIKIYNHEKKLSNKNVFSCLLNTVNEGAEVTQVTTASHYIFTV